MAIVKMKKLQLMVVRSQKDRLLAELTKLGCVEISEIDELPGVLKSEGTVNQEAKNQQNAMHSALKVLDTFAPEKTKLLAAKPEVSQERFLSNEGYDAELAVCEHINELEQMLREISSGESRLRGELEALMPWSGLDMPLQTAGTKYAAVFMGTLPGNTDMAVAAGALEEKASEAELFEISSDKIQHYAVLVCSKDVQLSALEALREFGFAQTGISSMEGTAAENIAAAEEKLAALAKQKKAIEAEITELASHKEAIKLCSDRAETAIGLAEAESKLAGCESVVCLMGWLEAPAEKKFAECVSEFDCAWETEDPAPEEYSEVPVKLANNAFTEPLNMATNMYSLPAYGSIDPNPVMSVFFILFYGIMMADMGYGLIMVIFALLAIKKSKPRGGRKYFFGLMLECGISTFIMGILSGGFFSNAIPTVYGMFGKECPIGFMTNPLIDPLNDTNTILICGMLLGVIHLFTGMFTNWYMKARDGHFMDGVWDEGTWMVLLIGLALYFGPGFVSAINISTTPGLVLLIVGGLMLIYGSGRNAKGIKKLTALGGAIYNGVTGWFGDILSYSRLMALMLAGSVVGQVFNTLAAMPSEGGVTVFSVIAFVLIFVIGHAINFGLNILGCFAHDLRLQCLEFFGKFYQDGGKPFRPLGINTEYVNVDP